MWWTIDNVLQGGWWHCMDLARLLLRRLCSAVSMVAGQFCVRSLVAATASAGKDGQDA